MKTKTKLVTKVQYKPKEREKHIHTLPKSGKTKLIQTADNKTHHRNLMIDEHAPHQKTVKAAVNT